MLVWCIAVNDDDDNAADGSDDGGYSGSGAGNVA